MQFADAVLVFLSLLVSTDDAELLKRVSRLQELERVVKLGEKARIREGKEKNEKYKKAVEELKRLENTQKDLEYRFKV